EAGLHQAERHAAGGGRRRGGAVRGDASPAGGCDGNTADADGLYGEGLKRMRKSERGTRNIRGEFEERRPDRHSPGCSAFRVPRSALLATLLLVCASSLSSAQSLPALPDTTGFGVHVLAIARAPDKTIWVGSYGQGIFVLRPGASSWEQLRHASDSAVHSISWDFVHAFGFGPAGEIWYGTVGNGGGLSRDGGRTWSEVPAPARVRALAPDSGDIVWVGTERGLYRLGHDPSPQRGEGEAEDVAWLDKRGRPACAVAPVVKGCRVDMPPIEGLELVAPGRVYAATRPGVDERG